VELVCLCAVSYFVCTSW